jgi:hypothetical protein
MKEIDDKYIGCFRHEGKLVEDGLLKARAASRALSSGGRPSLRPFRISKGATANDT